MAINVFDQKIAEIQEAKKAAHEKTEREERAIEKHESEIRDALEKKASDMLREIEADSKKAPGEKTATLCPVCSSKPSGIIAQVVLDGETRRKGLGVIVYYMRRQKSGELVCPKCGITLRAF